MKSKKAGIISIAVGVVAIAAAYYFFVIKPAKASDKSPLPDVPPNPNPLGNNPIPGFPPSPSQPSAGDRIFATDNEPVSIFAEKILSLPNQIGFIARGGVIGSFASKSGDWMQIVKYPGGSYPPNTPNVFYIYKSAKIRIQKYGA